jgi:hypothetical protein
MTARGTRLPSTRSNELRFDVVKNGSLALWYHWVPARKGQTTRSEAEIHVNFWRRQTRLFRPEETLLDIGVKLRHASSVESFNLFLPFSAKSEDIVDLGNVLRDERTLMAVFNEPYAAGDLGPRHSFPVRDKNGRVVFVCHTLRMPGDFTVTSRQYEGGPGATIAFTEAFCDRFENDQDQYLRFRINLNSAAASALSFYQRRADRWLLSGVPRDEVIEFRLTSGEACQTK